MKPFPQLRVQALTCGLLIVSARTAGAQGPASPTCQAVSRSEPATSVLPPPTQQAGGVQPSPTVGSIRIENLGVFDPVIPRYRRFPYTVLNRLHLTTRPGIIRRELLFHEGDPFAAELLTESERNIRNALRVNRAEVVPASMDRQPARNVLVCTEDEWTTLPQFVIDSQGGVSRLGVGVEEENLLGLAKILRVRVVRGSDQNLTRVYYEDGRLLDSHWQMAAETIGGDGSFNQLQVNRPFYSLDTRWGANTVFTRERSFDRLYDSGGLTARVPLSRDHAAAGFTRAWGDRVDKTKLSVGVDYERRNFVSAPLVSADNAPSWQAFLAQGGGTRRNNARIDLGVDREHYRFVTDEFLDKFGQVEDVRLGYSYGVSAGRAQGLAGRPDYMALAARASASGQVRRRHLVIASLEASTRREMGDFTNARATGLLQTYVHLPSQTLTFNVAGLYSQRMDQPFQFVLGEDTGLRGYPARQFTGNRGVLLSVEHRVYTPLDIFTARVGFAAFVDAGRVWREDERAAISSLKSSIGGGLRIGLVKSPDAPTIRLDVSVPVNPDGRRRPSIAFSFHAAFRMFTAPDLTVHRFVVD